MSVTSYNYPRYTPSMYSDMPGETRTSRLTNFGRTGLAATTRGSSLDRRKSSLTSSVTNPSSSSRTLPRTTTSRPLPTGPGPLDAYGKKLTDVRIRNKSTTSGIIGTTGPLKADYTSSYSTYGTLKAKSPQNENYGVTALSSSSLRRRSSSISSITDATRDMKLNGGREESYVTPRAKDRTFSRSSKNDSVYDEESHNDVRVSSRNTKTSILDNSVRTDVGRPPSGRRRDSSQDFLHETNSSSSLSSVSLSWSIQVFVYETNSSLSLVS